MPKRSQSARTEPTAAPDRPPSTQVSNRPRVGEQHEVVIERLAYGGSGVGRLARSSSSRGIVVFVPRSAPGDRLRVRIERVRRRHAEAAILEILEPGSTRTTPPCPHYEQGCGGCSWQHLGYEAQLQLKEALVRDSLERIGGFRDVRIEPILPAEQPWMYRNKMGFSFHPSDGLGLHRSGDWRHVLPVTECRLLSELAMRILERARQFAQRHELDSWDPVTHEGLLRELVVRQARGTNQTMVGVVTSPGPFPGKEFAMEIAALDASIVSVMRGIREGLSDGSPVEATQTLWGENAILERISGLQFRIGLLTFFQTNTAQAEQMLRMVREDLSQVLPSGPGAATVVLDMFCGVGFFSLGTADLADTVVGVEIVEESILAARENAALNGIDNVVFHAGDARRTLPEVIRQHGTPEVVILDPPRSGAGGKVMRRIARTAARRIVYVSCNPTTLARDLRELEPFGYRVTRVRPIDLFPQTYHVETVVTIDRDPDRQPAG